MGVQKLVQGPPDKSKFLAASKIKSQRQSFGTPATCPDLIDSQAAAPKLVPSGTTLILVWVRPGGGGVTKTVGQSQVRALLFTDYPVELVRMIPGI